MVMTKSLQGLKALAYQEVSPIEFSGPYSRVSGTKTDVSAKGKSVGLTSK